MVRNQDEREQLELELNWNWDSHGGVRMGFRGEDFDS